MFCVFQANHFGGGSMRQIFTVFALVLMMAGCSGGNETPEDVQTGTDQSVGDESTQDTVVGTPSVYAGSASQGDLVVFSVDHDAGTCEVVNETTGQNSEVSYTVMGGDLEGILQIEAGGDKFYAVELNDKLIAASFDTGNPNNTISFGVSGGTDNMANQANIPGDYVYIHIDNLARNGSTDIKEWGLLSIIDDGTFRVKAYATDLGDGSDLPPMAPEMWSGAFPVEVPNIEGTWGVNPTDHARINVSITGADASLTGFAYAPDPNGIFVLDMGTGYGFILAMKILPAMTLANLAGEYKYINVWNDAHGAGRSAGKAIINADGSGSFGALSTEGVYSEGVMDGISACPAIQNMFYTTSTESDGVNTVTLKHYFVLLPYAFMGFNFRTDGGFRFVGYAAGARLDQ